MCKVPEDLGIQGHLNGDADGFGLFRGILSCAAIMTCLGVLIWIIRGAL